MKNIGLVGLLLCSSLDIKAQTFNEWFKQKKTQTKYLVEQIAALQVYLEYVEKGYHLTRDGLTLIGDIKNGELGLHRGYFNSLKTVNPHIMKYPKIAAILSMQMDIINQQYSVRSSSKKSGQFSMDELDYIKKVFDNLEREAEKGLDELQLVLSDGKMKMTDDERITQVDKIYKSMRDKYSFAQSLSNKVKILIRQRKQGRKEAKDLEQLYGKH